MNAIDEQTSLRAEQASRVRKFLCELGVLLLVFLFVTSLMGYFFGASPFALPITVVLITLSVTYLNKKLLGSTDPDRPYESTADTD